MKLKWIGVLLVGAVLSGCSLFGAPSPQVLPTVVLDTNRTTPQAAEPVASGGVTASGIVVPARQSQLAVGQGAVIKIMRIVVGDRVQAGQLLLSLQGAEKLAAALESANLELLSAQQAQKALEDGAGQARAAAQLRLANAQKALDDAKQRRTWMDYRIGSDSDIQSAQAAVVIANNRLKQARDTYAPLENKDPGDLNRAAALDALSAAQKAYDQKVAALNSLSNQPNPVDVNQSQAVLTAAQAEVTAAQTQADALASGPDPDAAALAGERVRNAQAQVAALQAAQADLELKAPFAGTVIRLNAGAGEWVAPGQPLMSLADLAHLRIETTDLSERDVPQVAVGQPVTVLIKALNLSAPGHVSAIASLADSLGGDVVYKTTIDLDSQPAGLRAGMSVTVTFQ